MKLHGYTVERCKLCGGWPSAEIEIGGMSCCQCIACKHRSQGIETGPLVRAAVKAAVDLWNEEQRE